MAESYKVLEVTCPSCGEKKNINVPSAIFSQKKFGTVKIQVPMNAVCSEHQFIVFVDIKGVVRGYEKIDLHMASITPEEARETERGLNFRSLIQIFGLYGIFSLIHAKIFNYPAYILKDKKIDITEETLNKIGDMILPESLGGNKTIYIIDDSDISKLKITGKDKLVMDTQQHIFQTPWATKLKFEEEILERALGIFDEKEQIKLLQQDIAKLIGEANHTSYILQNVKEIYEDELVAELSKELKIKKITSYRLSLIKEYLKRNVSVELISKIKSRVGEFLSII